MKCVVKETVTWSDLSGCTRIFHVYINGKHTPENCGVDYVDVKKRLHELNIHNFKFERLKEIGTL